MKVPLSWLDDYVGLPSSVAQLAERLTLAGLEVASVRVLGFAPIEDFVGYLGACDVVLNLRFPTVGESSGTLLRSLGLGKAVMVSEIGSFAEFPDDVCLKVPVGHGEEDLIFEYLNLLVSRQVRGQRPARRAPTAAPRGREEVGDRQGRTSSPSKTDDRLRVISRRGIGGSGMVG